MRYQPQQSWVEHGVGTCTFLKEIERERDVLRLEQEITQKEREREGERDLHVL